MKTIVLAGRTVSDFRRLSGHDEYEAVDPYPKSLARDLVIAAYVQHSLLPMLPELTERDCQILDAGCGTGDWLSEILKQTSARQHSFHVAEYSPTALAKCLERNPRISSASLFDANDYPFEGERFDVILSINVFEHIAAPVVFMERALRSLRPKGTLFISTPSRYRFGNLLRVLLGKRPILIHNLHVTEYTINQMKEMAAFAGGKVTAVEGVTMTEPGQRHHVLAKILSEPLQKALRILGSSHLMHKTIYYRIEPQA